MKGGISVICPYCESDDLTYHDSFLDTDTYWCNDCEKYFDVWKEYVES